MSPSKRGHRSAAELEPLYRPNIFHAAWPMVRAWGELDWGKGAVSRRSSQALAVDVFGTIALSPARDAVLDALAAELGLPAGGPWQVDLEWWDRENALGEPQSTPMDVVLRSPRLLLCVECKFAEPDGGVCKQTRQGKHLPAQCSGAYAEQVNPRNRLRARCALTAKGARYWDWVPRLFAVSADHDHQPCPFAGPWYQWMRLMAITASAADREGRQPAFAVVYVDAPRLPMARKDWTALRAVLREDTMPFRTLSFQRVLALAAVTAPTDPIWPELTAWVERKVAGG
jgi:hypothetical protein